MRPSPSMGEGLGMGVCRRRYRLTNSRAPTGPSCSRRRASTPTLNPSPIEGEGGR
jgi:hypothetical protein